MLAVLPRSAEGGELVPGGAGPWSPVRVRGFRMSRRRPLHSPRAETSSEARRDDREGGYPILVHWPWSWTCMRPLRLDSNTLILSRQL